MPTRPPIPFAEAAGPSGSTYPRSSSKQGQRGPHGEREAGSTSDEIMEREGDLSDDEDVDQEEIGEGANFHLPPDAGTCSAEQHSPQGVAARCTGTAVLSYRCADLGFLP